MKRLKLFSLAVLLSGQVYAYASPWTPIIAVGGGITNTINLGYSTSFPIINPDEDEYYRYSPTHKSQTVSLFETFLGVEHLLYKHWLLQLGLAYSQSGYLYPKGELVQGVDVASQDFYQYRFNLTARQVMLQTKWMYMLRDRYYPYVLFGMGAAFNTASNFTTTVPPALSFTRVYADKTISSFAFRIGAGVDVDLNRYLRLGIAYRITDVGGYKLGRATIAGDAVSGTLSQSAVYANEVLAQLTYHI